MNFSLKTLSVAAAAALVSSAAFAADLPSRKAPVYAPVAPAYSWAGLYVGANVGYGFVQDDVVGLHTARGFVGDFGKVNSKGIFGGLQAGYNWQRGNWVYGLEADAQISGMRAHSNVGGVDTRVKDPFFGTVRARVGYAFDRTLLYVTGGAGFTDIKYRMTSLAPAGAVSNSRIDVNYVAGAGVEYAVTNNWSTKLEYLYVHTGKKYISSATIGTNETQSFHTIRVGLNYKFGGPSAIVAKY